MKLFHYVFIYLDQWLGNLGTKSLIILKQVLDDFFELSVGGP